MLALQSDRYQEDPDYGAAVDRVLFVTDLIEEWK